MTKKNGSGDKLRNNIYWLSQPPGIKKEWNLRHKHVCKPCWELKYCPYGALVETFPLLGPTRDEAIQHNQFLKKELALGHYKGRKRKLFENEVRKFRSSSYPKKHNKQEIEKSCSVFRHMCPVFFVNEPFTETNEFRKISRHISREIMFKVVRRDNYTCQICGKHLKDNEIEFDHRIPFSKGGSSEETNYQLTCFRCNRRKSKKMI